MWHGALRPVDVGFHKSPLLCLVQLTVRAYSHLLSVSEGKVDDAGWDALVWWWWNKQRESKTD